MREISRLGADSFNGRLVRDKRFNITGPEDGMYQAQASLVDGQHDMKVSLAVNENAMEILMLEASMDTVPYDACPSALDALQALVGMRIQPGLFKEM